MITGYGTAIFTGKRWELDAPHAPARLIRQPLLITSGITARAPDGVLVAPNDMRGQCLQVVANLVDVLVAGGTNTGAIVKVTIYVTSIDQFLAAKDAWLPLFVNRPSSTLIEVKRLQVTEMVVEIEALAELSSPS